MSRFHFIVCFCAAGALALCSRVAGAEEPENPPAEVVLQDEPAYETVIYGQPILETDETTSMAETVDVADDTRRLSTLADAVDTAVGVDVRRLGGLGAYGAVSVRGCDSSQVPVYLDGVQLNAGGFATVDLGALGLDVIDRIEIYRGHAPPSLPSAGIGGALVLETKAFEKPFTELVGSAGTFGTSRILALRGQRIGPVRALALVSMLHTEGDFDYFDRNGTLHDTADDAMAIRENNASTAYEAFLKLNGEAGGIDWVVADDFGSKRQGLPGTESVRSRHAELRGVRNALSVSASSKPAKSTRLRADASYLALAEDLRDPEGEIGVGSGRVAARTDAVGLGLAGESVAFARHDLSARLDGRFERFSQRDFRSSGVPHVARRVLVSAVIADDWNPWEPLRIAPSVRMELRRSAFDGGTFFDIAEARAASSATEFAVQPSLGARAELWRGLFARGNVGRYVRKPDLSELFGDRGFAVGNPDLVDEVGWNADVGLGYGLENRRALDSLRLEASAFTSSVRDLVVYVQNSQDTVRPENVARARLFGAEASFRLGFLRLVTLQAAYTFLRTENRTPIPYLEGRALPGRPAHELYAKASVGRDVGALGLSGAVDVAYTGATYLDQANLKDSGTGAALLGAEVGVEHLKWRVSLTLELDNLLDTVTVVGSDERRRPLSDFEGFPLPGRSFLATLRWRN